MKGSKKMSMGKESKMIKKSEKSSDKKMGGKPPMKPVKKGR
jgi:hypothetical protein